MMDTDQQQILKLAATCFFTSLALSTIAGILGYIYHKRAKMQSFVVIDHFDQALFLPNPVTKKFKAVGLFFHYSLFSMLVAGIKEWQTACIALAAIYAVSLLLALGGYFLRKREIARLDKTARDLIVKGKRYSLFNHELRIDDRRLTGGDGSDEYGLYLKHKNKWTLVHGFSIRSDITALSEAISKRARGEGENNGGQITL